MRAIALALAVLRNRTGGVPRPAWCTYIVTYRCNARCRMCDSWRLDPGDELTPAQVGEVFAKLGRLDVVRLTGGEPFLRPDLPAVVEQVLSSSRPAVVHISTNGSFPERAVALVERCTAPRRLWFMVSLDGLAPEHDRNRGQAVSFARALETVRRLAALRQTHGITVSVNHTVISPQSLADNAGLRAALAELEVEVHSVPAYADSALYGAALHGRQAEHLIVPNGYPLHPRLATADVVGFLEQELARATRYKSPLLRWGKRYYLRGLLARLRCRRHVAGPEGGNGHGRAHTPPRPPCVALRSHVRLLPDGSVPVCQFNSQSVGNLLEQPFAEVWRGRRAGAARAWAQRCPGCWAECEVLPNAIYTADILRPW